MISPGHGPADLGIPPGRATPALTYMHPFMCRCHVKPCRATLRERRACVHTCVDRSTRVHDGRELPPDGPRDLNWGGEVVVVIRRPRPPSLLGQVLGGVHAGLVALPSKGFDVPLSSWQSLIAATRAPLEGARSFRSRALSLVPRSLASTLDGACSWPRAVGSLRAGLWDRPTPGRCYGGILGSCG